MSDTDNPRPSWEQLSDAEKQSALFANLVMQQTNAALLMLGQVPHPESGKAEVDLEGAKLFIDTIEMLQARMGGKLSKQEEGLLRQSLTMLRLAFVEKANAAEAKPEPTPAPATPPTPAPSPEAADTAESRKKFTKKY
jgi:hypothetical protein